MKRKGTITDEKVLEVKEKLASCSIQEAARRTRVSYYTAWCISKGKYDSDEPLQVEGPKRKYKKSVEPEKITQKFFLTRCPITGFKL